MKRDDILVTYGPEGSDCTRPYYITLKRKDITVEEFVKFILTDSDWKREWGYVDIFTNKKQMPFKPEYALSYSKGEAKGTLVIPNKILQSTIKQISGSGGWTRSDFYILIKENTKMEKDYSNWIDTVIQKRISDRRKESTRCTGEIDEYQMFRVELIVRVPGENATTEHIKELIDEAFMAFVSGKATTNKKEKSHEG